MSTSTLDQHAPQYLKAVQETTPHPCFALCKIEVSHAACEDVSFDEILDLRPVTMETRCFHKKLEFSRYPPKDFCTARYERKSSKKKVSNFSKTRKKKILGPILGQDRPEKNSAKCSFEAARFRVLDRHRSTKPTTAP